MKNQATVYRIATIYFLAMFLMAFVTQSYSAQAQLARRVKDINTTFSAAASLPSNAVQIGNITMVQGIAPGAASSSPEALTDKAVSRLMGYFPS